MKKLSLRELNRKSIAAYKAADKFPIIIVLDNIRSALNVGSVFRTSDAFAVEALYLCGITAQPPHREILKTAIGASQSVEWRHFETTQQALSELRAKSYKIVAVEQAQNSVSLENYKRIAEEKIALVFGNEVNGVAQSIMDNVDDCIEIPQYGTKHSLNIAVSVGVVLWELIRKGLG